MEKSLVRNAVMFVCVSVLYSLNILSVHADLAPIPDSDPSHVFTFWPIILIAAVVVTAVFLYRKFRS